MKDSELLGLALGLVEPWFVKDTALDVPGKALDIVIDFKPGGALPCSGCNSKAKAYDTTERTWRHLDFFEYRTTLRARMPRVSCDACGVTSVSVPWARPGSGFTLLFEAFVTGMALHMAVAPLARHLGENDGRIWRILDHRVNKARAARNDSAVRQVAIDETSAKRGHDYVSLFADLTKAQVLFVTDGKDSSTVERFAADLRAHGGDPAAVTDVCSDMSAAFLKGIAEFLPNAEVTLDKFHIVKLLGDAVDKTRREDRRDNVDLKGKRYVFLRNPSTMSDSQLEDAAYFLSKRGSLKTVRAFHMKLNFIDFYEQTPATAERFLEQWCAWAQRSRVPAMIKVQRTIRQHWDGVLRWFQSRVSNGMMEAINGLVQSAKRRARGYRSKEYLKTIIYLIAGKLDLQTTHT